MSDGTAVPAPTAAAAVRRGARALRYLVGDLLAGLLAVVLLMVGVVVAVLSVVGVGLLLAGPASRLVRGWADRERARTGRFLGHRIDPPYVGPSGAGLAAARAHATSGALARDAAALAVRALVGLPLGAAAALLPLVALNAAVIPLFWWALPEGRTVGYLFADAVTTWGAAATAGLSGLAGLVLWAVVLAGAPLDARAAGALLATSSAQEQRRRADIERVRRESAVSAHSAELRRIERDLHDAAQNRLVAVAMYVGMARRQLETGSGDPGAALDRAGRAATDAIAEVRRVIQGIYPPVLTEEGLVPALGVLVDQCHVATRLHVDRPGATPAAVDSALYFSVAELLTNVAKHSGAREASVSLAWADQDGVPWVTAVVRDDGRGGADRARGSGLAGIEARVQALGGRVRVTSPPGGPTTVEMGLPCAP